MRQKRTVQSSIFDLYAEHEIGRELEAMSDWLDGHPEVLDWMTPELCRADVKETGREGLSVESILRCAILKQHRQLSYEALAFYPRSPTYSGSGIHFRIYITPPTFLYAFERPLYII